MDLALFVPGHLNTGFLLSPRGLAYCDLSPFVLAVAESGPSLSLHGAA